MTDSIDLLDEASWLKELEPPLRDNEPPQIRGGRTVGDLRRLLAMARDAERLRAALDEWMGYAKQSKVPEMDDPWAFGYRAGWIAAWTLMESARAALEGPDR